MDQPTLAVVKQCLSGVLCWGLASFAWADMPYPLPDPFLGEKLQPREIELAEELGTLIESEIRQTYGPGAARRDAHPKPHGCVNAEFRVGDSVPESLQQGVFQSGSTYRAIIRFSNGDPDPDRPDGKGDTRGMAIKLLDVPGDKLLDVQSQADTQDFLLISSPYFFVNKPDDYYQFFRAVYSDSLLAKLTIPFHIGLRGSIRGFQMRRTRIANPVSARYWSAVPYQLGMGEERKAVKYSVMPCVEANNKPPKNPGDNFLREAMQETLSQNEACMTFMVQVNEGGLYSVENSVKKWSEARLPFVELATIKIPSQVFDTPEKNEQCENLSFNPWHALPEHRPLGAVNRMRKAIYFRISSVRHEMNGKVVTEP